MKTNTAKNNAFEALCEYVNGLGCLNTELENLCTLADFTGIADASDLESKITYSTNPFDEEIIYYSRAMDFLKEYDPSLRDSLSLAAEYGYSPANLNSETLASLLATDMNRDTWNRHAADIDELINEINEADENDEADDDTTND